MLKPLTVVGFLDVAMKPDLVVDSRMTSARRVDLGTFANLTGDDLIVCYSLASGDTMCRLSKGTSYGIEEHGDAVVANYLLMDVDREPHEPWPEGFDVEAAIRGAINDASDTAMGNMDFETIDLLESAAWYATPRGYRLMWSLAEPLPIRQYEPLFKAAAEMLKNVGIRVDTQTVDWTRLSYTPRAKGRRPAAEDYEPLNTPLDVADVFGALPEAKDEPAKKASAGDLEDLEPHPEAWEHWGVLPGWLRTGPFPGDTSGERFKAMRGAVAAVARVLPTEDLDDEVVLRALVGAWNATEDAGLAGTWGWSDIEGLAGHILDGEEKQRKAMENMQDWFKPKAVKDLPAGHVDRVTQLAAEDLGTEPPAFAEPEEPTEDDMEKLRSVATNQKLRGLIDRLVGRHIPTTDAQTSSRRDLLRQLSERAFAGRGFYGSLSPQDVAESLYRVLGTYIEATGMQTHDELIAFLQRVGQEAAEARRREARRVAALSSMQQDLPPLLVLGHTGSFYVLDSRGPKDAWSYVPAASSVLGQVLRSYAFPGIPEELHVDVSGARGGLRSASEFVDEYEAPVIQQVIYDYNSTRASVDGDALVLPTIDRPRLVPTYHAAVDAWLRALAGSDETYDTLILWLVAAQDLSLPLQCLYLTGSGGAGKTLLQKGLERLWSGRSIDFNEYLLDNFPDGLLKTPLFLADDGITVDPRSVHRVSNVFRRVLTEDARSINIKYQPKVTLRGHFRLVVSANGDTGIPFTQALGRDALMALAERIFHIDVGDAARDVLEAFRGTPEGEGFITPTGGKLPEHILFLAQSVALPPVRKRFAVEVPNYTAWAEEWSSEQGILPESRTAVAYITRKLREGQTIEGAHRLADDDTMLLLQPSAIRVGWKEVSSHRKAPNNKELRQALEDLSTRATGTDYGKQKYGVMKTTASGARLRGYLFPLKYVDVDAE